MLFRQTLPTLYHFRLLILAVGSVDLLIIVVESWTQNRTWLLGLHLLTLACITVIYTRLGNWHRGRDHLGEVANALVDGFVLYDHDDRLLHCNEAFAAFYQASPAELHGQDFRKKRCWTIGSSN